VRYRHDSNEQELNEQEFNEKEFNENNRIEHELNE